MLVASGRWLDIHRQHACGRQQHWLPQRPRRAACAHAKWPRCWHAVADAPQESPSLQHARPVRHAHHGCKSDCGGAAMSRLGSSHGHPVDAPPASDATLEQCIHGLHRSRSHGVAAAGRLPASELEPPGCEQVALIRRRCFEERRCVHARMFVRQADAAEAAIERETQWRVPLLQVIRMQGKLGNSGQLIRLFVAPLRAQCGDARAVRCLTAREIAIRLELIFGVVFRCLRVTICKLCWPASFSLEPTIKINREILDHST
mmetsp:Transcript_82801/g.268209  ORF Transcript_82801/g.268209 Transcript_82801/m.268209 type:complete len:260 (+) Transcript_82801:797-1576(+)